MDDKKISNLLTESLPKTYIDQIEVGTGALLKGYAQYQGILIGNRKLANRYNGVDSKPQVDFDQLIQEVDNDNDTELFHLVVTSEAATTI